MFHMEDFERIARKSSQLDALYADSRDIVQREVDDRRKRLRDLSRRHGRAHSRADRARAAGARLSTVADIVQEVVNRQQNWGNQTVLFYQIDGTDHDEEAISEASFWESAAEAGAVTVIQRRTTNNQRRPLLTLGGESLWAAVPEAADSDSWKEIDERALREEKAELEADITRFRGAGFEELLHLSNSFNESLEIRMMSEMARELVREGYLTRHFSTYAAQFYGDFTGVDVVTFIMQTVETNSVDIEYQFSTPGAVANLLAEAGNGFTKTVSALNIDVLDYLIREEDPRRDDVARQVIDRPSDHTNALLSSYLTAGAHPDGFVRRLAVLGWPKVLRHLAADDAVPDERRSSLFDAALQAPVPINQVTLGDSVSDFVVDHHHELFSFTANDDPRVVQAVTDLVTRLDWRVPDLVPLSQSLRHRLIERDRYEVTAGNLRLATGSGDIRLETLAEHPTVYAHALSSPGHYLHAVNHDRATAHAVEHPETLIRVLEDVEGEWHESDVAALLDTASADACLTTIRGAPQPYWDAIAIADLVEPSLANVIAYLDRDGRITAPLGGLLLKAKRIVPEPEADADAEVDDTKARAAVAVINAAEHIPSLGDRIEIVQALAPIPKLPVESIEADDTKLLSSLLAAGLVHDNLDVFVALRPSSWDGMAAALQASASAAEFATAELLDGYVKHVLSSPTHRDRFGHESLLTCRASFQPTNLKHLPRPAPTHSELALPFRSTKSNGSHERLATRA